MPVPRRHVSLLASAAAGTVPIYHDASKTKQNTIKRCGRCRCILASDQTDHWCSPCQRRFNGMPPLIGDYFGE